MAATPVTVQTVTTAGVLLAAATAADTSNGNSFVNDGSTIVIAKNTGGSSYTVTETVTATLSGLTVSNKIYTLAAGDELAFRLLSTDVVGSTTTLTGNNTAVTFRPLKLG